MKETQNGGTLVTIVTVCYNVERFIAKTMKSVLEQTYENIEYIIKDGESSDKTNEIIENYRKDFEQKGISLIHIIKKDNGIYDAMNQATYAAAGEYINYMNADDVFFDENVLSDIFKNVPTADLLYGDVVCEYEFVRNAKRYVLWRGQHQNFDEMPISHQACFFRTELMKQYYYSTEYKMAADFNLLACFYLDGRTFFNSRRIVAICTMDGVSNTRIKTSYLEPMQVKERLGMKESNTLISIWLMGVKQWILDTLPYWFVGRLLMFQVRRKGNTIYSSLEQIKH